MGRIVLLFLFAALVSVAYWMGFAEHLSLDALKAQRDWLMRLRHDEPLLAVAGFWLVYVMALAASLPGAMLSLALASGAIFGLLIGTAVIITASAVGSSLAFVAARYIGRDWVRRRFAAQINLIDRGIERDGAYYLLSLRLIGLIPNFMLNVVMALTTIRVSTFAVVTFIGTAPIAAIYANAGEQLAAIRSISDVLSADTVVALLLLGFFPLAVKLALRSRLST